MELIKKLSLANTLFCLYLAKTFVIPASWSEAIIVGILGGMVVYHEYKAENHQIKELHDRLDIQAKEIENLKTQMASVKLATGMRNINGR